ncbi:hypothetical protein [Bartonella grahamii]|uniref:hypothetical protein n=1 Tax=Bartonella grahamii TaxID=33045 RepID=UPI001ABBD74E|nr:hypothetical protein [Bartonella grahamii]
MGDIWASYVGTPAFMGDDRGACAEEVIPREGTMLRGRDMLSTVLDFCEGLVFSRY